MKYDIYSFLFHKLLTAVLRLVAPQFRCTVEYCATNFWRPLTVGLTINSKHLYLKAVIDYDSTAITACVSTSKFLLYYSLDNFNRIYMQ